MSEFLRQLADLSHQYQLGIAGTPTLFVMEKDDFAMSYVCDDDSNLGLGTSFSGPLQAICDALTAARIDAHRAGRLAGLEEAAKAVYELADDYAGKDWQSEAYAVIEAHDAIRALAAEISPLMAT